MAITLTPSTLSVPVTAGAPVVSLVARTDFESSLDDDLTGVFFNDEEFAGPLTVTHADGTVETVDAIWDEEGSALDIDIEAPMTSSEPQFTAPTRAFAKLPERDDLVTRQGREFRVKNAHPDGTGVLVVELLRD